MTFHDESILHAAHSGINNTDVVARNAAADSHAAGEAHTRNGVDVAVMTALPEELAAVARILAGSPSYECLVGEGKRPVHRAEPLAGWAPLTVVATVNASTGGRTAVSGFEYLRRQFAPAVVVMLGTAGGIHSGLRIGDVVIGDEVIYYDLGKKTPDGAPRRGISHPVPAVARHIIGAFLAEAGDPAEVIGEDGPFRVYAGPIGSGAAVVAAGDSPARDFLTDLRDRPLALEMESGGVAQAHSETAELHPRVHAWFPLRGISDLADEARDDKHQAAAVRNAATVFERMLPHLRVNSC